MIESWGHAGGRWAILVHGGAGDVPDDRVARHVDGCRAAVAQAAKILEAGGSALNAAQRAVEIMEDDPVLNAGTGACLNADGELELDAAIMDGAALRSGGVCALPPFKNPIAVARAVLEEGRHVLYAAEGAARFALARGFVRATHEAMTTEAARVRLAAAKQRDASEHWAGGTVGAVVRDIHGHVVAATSTGGMVNKARGRVGDTPVPGAGNYADEEAGAASGTGEGERFLQICAAKTAVDRMRALEPQAAAIETIRILGDRVKGKGGIILVGRDGRLGLARNTRTMTWAAAAEGLAVTGGS